MPEAEVVAQNALAFAFRDAYPVSPGHTLVVPRRVVATWFEATREEQLAIMELVDQVKADLDEERHPDGYNVGFNAGAAAGQTVFHLHVHVIPRYTGDMPDPRGGVRLAIPHKGNYLRSLAQPLSRGGPEDPFLKHLRPLFQEAEEIAILAAFAQESGIRRLDGLLETALARGAWVRVLTGDYLHITQERALRRLLDLVEDTADGEEDDPSRLPGRFEARVVETARLAPGGRSFHPKCWRFQGKGFGTAFVGSSNLSASALTSGVEWNLRLDQASQPDAWESVVTGFDGWWERARELDEDWLAGYRERAQQAQPLAPLPLGEEDAEPLEEPLEPRKLQAQALDALESTRAEGRERALVVMATGLGKTYLAAFDVVELARQREAAGEDFPRVLFLAHQAQILRQAARTFRRVLPEARFGWFQGKQGNLAGDLVFASVQKMCRPEHLAKVQPDDFDYVVIDEVHHAAAPSYRRIIDHLQPRFLLGLTATPDRADEADLLGLFDDNEAYRADLGRGIAEAELVPFAYHGLKDTIDYAPIPWRNSRFAVRQLVEAAQTQARMTRLWEAWAEHPGQRTLVFCCSIAHANFVRDWLREAGARVSAVHTGEGAIDRDQGLEELEQGALDALCTVDLFNEGVDLPSIDRVVFLRPTESPVIFLQQLGRGLRTAPESGKTALTVIDFVGNHRVFLDRVRTLLSLVSRVDSIRDFLERGEQPELPEGCSVEIELEAVDLLRSLLPKGDSNELVRVYRELKATREGRPTAGELFRMGLNPRSLRRSGGWIAFLAEEGDLSAAETAAWAGAGEWFRELETTAMTKSFKMVTLQVMLERRGLLDGIGLFELAIWSERALRRQPELLADIEGVKELAQEGRSLQRWGAYWKKNPVQAWCNGRWFRLDGDRLVSRFPELEQDAREALRALTAELVDLRLAQYRRRRRQDTLGQAFEAKVISNKRDPILKLPDRAKQPSVPDGETDVRLPDGKSWRFRLMKIACNVARPVGTQKNGLPDLLRGWFGPSAGKPGTDFWVRFSPSPDGWWVEPMGSRALELRRGELLAFPSLQAAAGLVSAPTLGEVAGERISLPGEHDPERDFAVRVSGDSMDGGDTPLRHGDWAVLRWQRQAALEAVLSKVALVARADGGHVLKRVTRGEAGFLLRSDSPAYEPVAAEAGDQPLAILQRVVTPESLAPAEGARLSDEELGEAFGLDELPQGPVVRANGLLLLLVRDPALLSAPDRLELAVDDLGPAETAYVFTGAAAEPGWRYAGVGRWDGEQWGFPALDLATWRDWASRKGVSRTLAERWKAEAERVVDRVLKRAESDPWFEAQGKRCRVVGSAGKGGVRIDGGPGGFKERTVSLTDLGFVLHARVTFVGEVVDEAAAVNRVRYLEGAPKASTRWIDTGWALTLVASVAAVEGA